VTQYLFPPDPRDHWSDRLAEEASQEWSRQHRLQWLWLRLRLRLKGTPRLSELEPGEGRAPGLQEPELDPDESARIRRAWLVHVARIRTRTLSELIDQRAEEKQRKQERWIKGGIRQDELEELRRQAEADERMRRQLQRLLRLMMWLLPTCRLAREMQTCWLMAPSRPAVFLSVCDATVISDDGPAFSPCLVPLSRVRIWRWETSGGCTLLSDRTVNDDEARAMWRQRRARGWRPRVVDFTTERSRRQGETG
jgi:hypothetical protein